MTRYEVDVPAVDGLSSQVSAVGVEVRATSGHLNAGPGVDVGDPGLGAALSEFGQVWAGFAEAAAQAVDGTAGAISAASQAYVRVDESVVADLRVTSVFVGAVAAGADGAAALGAATSGAPAAESAGRAPR